jgi:hypothetical protein
LQTGRVNYFYTTLVSQPPGDLFWEDLKDDERGSKSDKSDTLKREANSTYSTPIKKRQIQHIRHPKKGRQREGIILKLSLLALNILIE